VYITIPMIDLHLIDERTQPLATVESLTADQQGFQQMLAKLTTRNRLTLPKDIVKEFPGSAYFEIKLEDGCVALTPARCPLFRLQHPATA
jgi:hypothetical protein